MSWTLSENNKLSLSRLIYYSFSKIIIYKFIIISFARSLWISLSVGKEEDRDAGKQGGSRKRGREGRETGGKKNHPPCARRRRARCSNQDVPQDFSSAQSATSWQK
jgi:hypothetical protein